MPIRDALPIFKRLGSELATLRESGAEVSHFIPESRNFAEVTKLSENIRKPWLKATLKPMLIPKQKK